MEELDIWIKKMERKVHPVILAAEIHERLATIHPFIDGNGRTARLLMNLVLSRNGYFIANIPGDMENRLSYYNALEKCNLENDKTDFILLVAGYALEGMERVVTKLR